MERKIIANMLIGGIIGAAGFLILTPLLIPMGRRLRRTRRALLAKRSGWAFDCGIRVTNGSIPGLTGRWRHSVAKFSRPGLFVWGRKNVEINLISLDDEYGRKPKLWESFLVNRSATVVRGEDAAGATVEIAIMPEDLDRFVSQARGPS